MSKAEPSTYTASLTHDRLIGADSENICHPLINAHFGEDFIKDPYKFAAIDFYNKNYNKWVELKSFTKIVYDPERDVPFRVGKVNYINTQLRQFKHREYWLFFFLRATNDLYYIKYDQEAFTKFKRMVIERYDRPGIFDPVVNIPMRLLSKVLLPQ